MIMDSMSDMLKSHRPTEPPQVAALKAYAQSTHGIAISVFSSARSYLIRVPNGAIAHKFRIETADITDICNLDKPLVIHIGQ